MSEPRYQVRGKIGQGGLGEVYLAHDIQLDREVALKRMKVPEDGNMDALAADLIREAKTLSALQHPHIVTVYDVGKDDKGPFLVLELLKGETLDEVIERGGMTLDDFKQVVMQTLEGLIAAQAVGLVHRDLKPGNLMVVWLASGKFQIKILDFGLAKFSMKARPQTEDQGGGIFGSIFFMAPEQFERLPLDARTDMYSLGCIYYQILTTKHPFDGETGVEVMASHLQHHVKPLQEARPDLPEWLCNWVMWLISREMEDRPADARTALEYFMAQRHKLKGYIPKPTTSVTARAPQQPARKAPPGVILPGQRPVRAPVGATTGPIVSPSHQEGSMAGARNSTQSLKRVPKKSSNAGVYVILSIIGLCLIGGLVFLFTASNEPVAPAQPATPETPMAQNDAKKPDAKTPAAQTPQKNPKSSPQAPVAEVRKPVPSPAPSTPPQPQAPTPAPAPAVNTGVLAGLTSADPVQNDAAVKVLLQNSDVRKREAEISNLLKSATPQEQGKIVSLAGLNDLVTSSGLLTSLLVSSEPLVKEQFYKIYPTWFPKTSIAQKLVEISRSAAAPEIDLEIALNMIMRSGYDAASRFAVLKTAAPLVTNPKLQESFSKALATITLKEAASMAAERKDAKAAQMIATAMANGVPLGKTPLLLEPEKAILVSGPALKIDPNTKAFTGWSNPETRLAWDVECKEKGTVIIQVQQSSTGAKPGKYRINFGNYGRTFTVAPTASADAFAVSDPEVIEIAKSDSGKYRIVIEPVDIPAGQELMHLKSIVLTRH